MRIYIVGHIMDIYDTKNMKLLADFKTLKAARKYITKVNISTGIYFIFNRRIDI
jgi:hypothetical protein